MTMSTFHSDERDTSAIQTRSVSVKMNAIYADFWSKIVPPVF